MKEKNYLSLGLVVILLFGLMVTTGCFFVSTSRISPVRQTGDGGAVGPSTGGEGLPIIDRTVGTEPVTRYPGSVMLSHLKMEFTDEETGLMIGYGTTDDVDTVANWYTTQLESDGWGKEMDISSEGTTMLVYMKGTENIKVDISPGEYTTIGILYSIEV